MTLLQRRLNVDATFIIIIIIIGLLYPRYFT